MTPIPHECKPGTWCGQCAHNVQCGLEPNHPGNDLPPTGKAETPTCIHLGKAVRIPGASRVFRLCMANEAPEVGGISACVQCSSRTGNEYRIGHECGPTCKRYSLPVVASAYAPYGVEPVTPYPVPRTGWNHVAPPKLPLTSRRAVVTVVAGEEAQRNYALVRKSHEAYAKRHNADYIALTGKTQQHGCFEKFRYRAIVEAYPDGTLCLDAADTWIHPLAPSIWDEVPAGHVGMTANYKRTANTGLVAWGAQKTRELCQTQGIEPPPEALTTYFNSGVWFGRPTEASYWTPPSKPTPGGWCDEENLCRVNMFRLGLKLHELDWRWNWTWSDDRSMTTIHEATPHIVHLAGMSNQGVPHDWRVSTSVMRTQYLTMLAVASAT